jgi:phosphatidylserine decarboxylase
MVNANILGTPAAPQYRGGLHGNWLTSDVEVLSTFIYGLDEAPAAEVDYHPVIKKYRDLVETDAVVRMYVTAMIDQVPVMYEPNPLRTPEDMLRLLNKVLTQAPRFNSTALVGCPMSAVIVWTMGTQAGFAAYRNEKINAMLKEILQVYTRYLDSEDSANVINSDDDGWMCAAAREKLDMPSFQYDPNAPHWGFKSWNDFFTRKLAKHARPVADPDNHKVIVSACDSTCHRIANDVRKYDKFWIKRQPYSLNDMLANDSLADEFVGGTVYQAYLNPFNYHRWHSPVSGTICKADVLDGLYFSQDTAEGVDPTAQGMSEEYVAHVQTRAVIYIDSDDKNIGLMCVMPVGMVEISSCMIDKKVKRNNRVEKGQELGFFQYGGSTHCLIFRRGAIKDFTVKEGAFCKVGEQIAVAR